MLERLTRPWKIIYILAGAIGCVQVSVLQFAETRPGNLDDAFILMVYMRHLAQQGGIFWNVQDGPVDGATSFLDLLLKTSVLAITGRDEISVAFVTSVVLHAAISVFALLLTVRLMRHEPAAVALPAGIAAGFLLAATPSIAEGSAFLLETPLFVLAVLALFGLVLAADEYRPGHRVVLVLLATLTLLARPEGLPLAVLAIAAVLFEHRQSLSLPARWSIAGSFAMIVLGYFAWRIQHFGYWAPNTYYAKKSELRWNEIRDGWAYVSAYAHTTFGLLTLVTLTPVPLAAIAPRWLSPASRFRFVVVETAALGSLAAVIFAGGDCYSGGRMLAAPIALGLLGLVAGVAGARGVTRLALVPVMVVIGVAQLAAVADGADMGVYRIARIWPLSAASYKCEQSVASKLQPVMAGGVIGETDFQRLKYFADDLRVLDLHGLNDRAIAHEPFEGPVLWGKFSMAGSVRRKPDGWILGYTYLNQEPLSKYRLEQLFDDPALLRRMTGYTSAEAPSRETAEEIARLYIPASLPACGTNFNLIVLKEEAQRFRDAGFTVGQPGPG